MELFYLDNPSERGTNAMLEELRCGVEPAPRKVTGSEPEVSVEHMLNHDVIYYVTEGTAFVDIRDSADCWIRAKLKAGEGVGLRVNAVVFRRIKTHIDNSNTKIVQCHLTTSSGTDLDINLHTNTMYRHIGGHDNYDVVKYHEVRELTCELCRQFFQSGWVTGTGGSISIRHGGRIYMTPSGVQKERLVPNELYVLDINGEVVDAPAAKLRFRPKLTDCSPLFMHAYKMRNAGAVLHSHAYSANMVTQLFDGKKEFKITHQEMIKGIVGHGYHDTLIVPIIENTAHENELADSLGEAMRNYPNTVAVLVRRHGLYVWGDNWEAAKRHGECLHYLFDMALQMAGMGMNFMSKPGTTVPAGCFYCSDDVSDSAGGRKRALSAVAGGSSSKKKKAKALTANYTHVVFDIEGTTTPISFVKEVLFPYSVEHVKSWLSGNPDPSIVAGVIRQAEGDGLTVPKNSDGSKQHKQKQADFLANYVTDIVAADRKDPGVKKAQGAIWEDGYRRGDLKSIVYDDVPPAFERLKDAGKHVCIYSSGSRKAQRLLFQYSDHGDLRPLLSCYFDTTCGHKRAPESYSEIALSLGVEDLSKILFVTDIVEEAQAANLAGMHAIISIREGNAPLLAHHGFETVTTFEDF